MDRSSLTLAVTCILAFLMGSVPFGLFIARIFGIKDLTSRGSKNIGATNVSRVAGVWPAGVLTLLLDAAKGALPVALTSDIGLRFLEKLAVVFPNPTAEWLPWCVGFVAVLGHCYSPWLRFRGGKGVATGLGALLLLSPFAALAGVIVFLMTFTLKRIGSLSSLTGLLFACATHLTLYPAGVPLCFGGAMAFLILLRHETNMDALLAGNEKTF